MRESKISETTEISAEKEKLSDLLKTLESSEISYLNNAEQADSILSKRLDYGNTESAKPMEEHYSTNWEKISENTDLSKNLKECNPNYDLGKEWKINCQRCVPTYEMRRRGYDVTAEPKPNEKKADELSNNPFGVWKNPKIIDCGGNGRSDIEKEMLKWGDGTRAQVVVVLKNTNSGHTFIAEQIDGKTHYFDPQTGSMDVTNYFKRVERNSVQLCRIDDLDVTNKIKDCCRKV